MAKEPADPELTKLDVEDEEQREERIGALLERLNDSGVRSSNTATNSNVLNINARTSYAAEPPSELLARVQAFLPSIKASNEDLAQQDPENLNIENIEEDEERYIEMNLGLGVFESRRRRSSSSASSSSDEESDSSSSESESSSDCSSSGGESPSDDSAVNPGSFRPIKPLPRRVAQRGPMKIEVLDSHPAPRNDSV
ncbi:hypothetical protein F5I97DRAFT_1925921 [Phlebopus sp. FC_14]|nr:hypothetical protein F5I97DRAFT_1925921 [Phlebopus sp. FC_14]